MRKHIFMRDAIYLRPGFLYDTLRVLPLNKQVQVLAVSPDNLRAAIFLAIPEGRSQQMVAEELATVEGNPETMEELKSKSRELLEDYRARLRNAMTEAEVEFAVVNECQLRRIDPPEHLKSALSLVAASASATAAIS